MSTYIPGVQEYVPQVQAFSPDYNFYNQAMTFKQGKHDASRAQLSNLYGSLLNAPLTRDDNVETRNKFFKTIEQDIQKMSGMDLSLAQNTEAAKGIFNQLLDNKQISRDMVWTKSFYDEMGRAESFKNCTDPEKCGGSWWEGGEQLLGYAREEYRNAAPDAAMQMGVPKFVAYQDVMKKAVDLANKAGLSVKQEQSNGKWIVTTKNGQNVVGGLEMLFASSIGRDPNVQAYYQAKAELNRKSFVHGNKEQYGSVEAAEQAYISQMANMIERPLGDKTKEADDHVITTQNKRKELAERSKAINPNLRKTLEELDSELQSIEEAALNHQSITRNAAGNIMVARNNKQYTGAMIDSMIANIELGTDIANSAKVMAQKDMEYSIEADPYGLEQVRHDNSMRMESFRAANAKDLVSYTKMLDAKYKELENQGYAESNNPEVVDNIPGGYTTLSEDPDAIDVQHRVHNAYEKADAGQRQSISSNERTILKQVMDAALTMGKTNNTTAQQDYIQLANQLIEPADRAKYNAAMSAAKTTAEKYKVAASFRPDPSRIDSNQVSAAYRNKNTTALLNPTDKTNLVTRDYLKAVWQNTTESRRKVHAEQLANEQLHQFYAKSSNEVIRAARSDGNYGDKWAKVFSAYTDASGKIVDKHTFIRNMAPLGYSNDKAASIWEDDDPEESGLNVHDMWRTAFSTYVKPEGPAGWTNNVGAGNVAGRGSKYIADPAGVKSIASLGFTGFVKDALNNENAIFSLGDFQTELPVGHATGKLIAQTLLNDYLVQKKGNGRPLLTVTYSDIAAHDENKVALNIKAPLSYTAQHSGGTKGTGIMGGETGRILSEKGLTIYVDKQSAQNIFTQNAKKTHNEVTLDWAGKIKLESQYVDKFEITADPSSGGYSLSGAYQDGWDDQGNPIMRYMQNINYVGPLQDLIDKGDQMIQLIETQNELAASRYNTDKN